MGILQLNPIRPLQWVSLFLISFAFLLFLCAVATPRYYDNGYTHFGAWQICEGGSCQSIDNNCNNLLNSNCSEFRAFRAFLLIAFFSSLITMIFAWIVAIESPQLSPYFSPLNLFVQLFGWFTSLTALIAFSIIADYINNTVNDGGNKSDAFGLLVSAWVFHSIGMVVWTISTVREAGMVGRSYSFDPAMSGVGGPSVVKTDAGYAPSAPAYTNSAMSEPTVLVVDNNSDTTGLTNSGVTTI